MHGATERPSTTIDTERPGSADPSGGPEASGDSRRTAALEAALSGIQTALAGRRSAAPLIATSNHQPIRRPAARARPQAVRRWRLARSIVSLSQSRLAGHALRGYEAYESLIDRGATGAVHCAATGLRALPRLLSRPAPAVPAVKGAVATKKPERSASSTTAPQTAKKNARPAWQSEQRWPFVRSEEVSVAYPKRRPGGYSDSSILDHLIGAIPMLASAGVLALVVGCYSNTALRAFSRTPILNAPTVTSRSVAEAQEAAQAMGLKVEVARTQPSDDAPKDTVLDQSPRPGVRVEPQQVAGQVGDDNDQSPRPGVRVEPGSILKLTVSGGLRPPNVIGKSVDQARVQLIIDGWRLNADVETRIANGSPPNVVVDQRPRPDEAAPQKGPVTLIVAAPNLAHARAARTSTNAAAPEAVDGQPATYTLAWNGAPSWFEIDLGGPVSVASVSLLPAVERPSGAVVELWAWDASGRFFPIHAFNREVADNVAIDTRLSPTVANVVRLRVATTASAGQLGWREVTVLGP